MITSVLSGCVWVILIIIVGGVLPSKKVLNSQRPRPAKPLGPRALRIPPSIPDLQNYSGVSNSFSSSPSPRNSPSTLFFLLLFCWSNHHYVWTHQKQEGRLSSRPVSTTMRFSSLPPPGAWLTVLSHQQYASKHTRKQRPYLFSCPTAWCR